MTQKKNKAATKVVATEKVVDKAPEVVPAEKVEDQDLPVFPAETKVEASKTPKFDKESKALFNEYPDNSAFHFTSDGLAFFQHNDARNHASTLEEKEVISKVRK